ncbi:efflux transporter outer membrane subunit [Labrys monachus]|uniref:NodT family efflux transporter outer membrane factor (OMF) lipoprotein n=1 Tax=Labrys monachus TaxID=217067 RepID=A0ABU0FDW4_9HYPH|nr:efflux transporter outer membrane subunit [Labrys monachus]MDQ0392706.1 NodT family efflux transporter outer membrane factor (OMF) lipoprotein [Labrys monachus]
MFKIIRDAGRLLMGSAALTCLAGCAVGPDYHPALMAVPSRFAAAGLQAGGPMREAPVDPAKWWLTLHDRELDSLVARALAGNTDLEIALDRMQEARTQEAVVLGSALPSAGFSAGAARGTGTDLASGRAASALVAAETRRQSKQVDGIAGFDGGWEIDLFGRYRREMEAAQADRQAAADARHSVLVSVVADVARAYVEMRAAQRQADVVRETAGALREYVGLNQQQFSRGISNELDFTLAQRELATVEAEKGPIEAEIRQQQYVIAGLVGEFPETLAKELQRPGPFPRLPGRIPLGLPADLLRQRPDILEGERELAADTAQIGVATADLFPRLFVTAGGGLEGRGAGVGPNAASLIWSIGPSLSVPLLDFGRLDALVQQAGLQAKEAAARYRQTVLNAVRDVDVAAAAYKGQEDRLGALSVALGDSRKAVGLANQRFQRGLTDSLNVIDAERQQYDLEKQYVSAQQSAAEAFIALYQALGDGWQDDRAFAAPPKPQPALVAAVRSLLGHDAR